jgi:CheY-like chemotaxis protein
VTIPSPTVFVVDDHAAVREALGEMLSVFGYAVKTYESADAFLGALDRQGAGCVVADVRIPGRDGIAPVREPVRRNVAVRSSPFPVMRMCSGRGGDPAPGLKIIQSRIDDTQLLRTTGRWRVFEQQDHHSRGAPSAAGLRVRSRSSISW